jgi:hypothetical protein
MIYSNKLLLTTTCILIISCNQEKVKTELEKNYKPEEVVQIWQKSVDSNNFDVAEKHSADEVLEYLNEIKDVNQIDSVNIISTVLQSNFKKLECNIKSDTITECETILTYSDGIETNDIYVLAKRNGNWMIKDILHKDEKGEIIE